MGPIVSSLPVSLRYGRTYAKWREYIELSRKDSAFTTQMRITQLQSLAVRAFDKSPYWREQFISTYGTAFNPNLFTFEHLSELPVLEKDTVRENAKGMLTVNRSEVDFVTTGGSSGKPLGFYLDKARSPKVFAFVSDNWARSGYTENDVRCVFRGVHMKNVDVQPWEWNSGVRELRCSPFTMSDTNLDVYYNEINARRIKYLHGYPSALEIFARHVLNSGKRFREDILGIFPVSEPLLKSQRVVLEEAFPKANILPNYAMSERVLYATEKEADVYEFDPLFGHFELIGDADEIIVSGNRGRIIGTGLLFGAMPLFRYDTGDQAELVSLPAEENGWRGIVRDIQGRRGQEFCVGKNSELISIAAINIHSKKYVAVKEFQFFQDQPGQAILRVVPATGSSGETLEALAKEFQKKIGSSLSIKLEIVKQIDRTMRGKKQFIDQRLELDKHLDV